MKKGLISFVVISMLAILFVGGAAFSHQVSKMPEAVFVNKLSVSQMSFAELGCDDFSCVSKELTRYASDFLSTEHTWTSVRGEVTLSLADMGASVDTERVARTVENFMIGTDAYEKLVVYLFGGEISYDLYLDEVQLKTAFAESGIEQGVKNASYSYSGGVVEVQPEQIGYGIDTAALQEILQEVWENPAKISNTYELPLRTAEPEFISSDLSSSLAEVQAVSDYIIELQGEWGSTWDLYLSDHIDWFLPVGENTKEASEVTGALESTKFSFQIDQEKLDEYIDIELVETVEEEPQPVTIIEDMDGNYGFEGSARFGKTILREQLADEIIGLLQAKLEETEEAPVAIEILIPLDTVEPEVNVPDSLREKGVIDLLEFGYTNFAGSPSNRIYNVNYGISIYDGHLIEQGEEFSFTTLLGPVDGAHGWREELVILGDETKPEYGGGLCQVSSTMYRAALYAGLPITMRKEHSYAVSYYAYPNGYGLDATVYQPYPDLRFVNDTGGAILIQGYTEGTLAYFVLYGTNDGRSVQMEGPTYYGYTSPGEPVTIYTDELAPGERQLEEHSHTGFQVDWYRTVTSGDGTVGERENIHTYYEARPEKWLEGKSEESKETEVLSE